MENIGNIGVGKIEDVSFVPPSDELGNSDRVESWRCEDVRRLALAVIKFGFSYEGLVRSITEADQTDEHGELEGKKPPESVLRYVYGKDGVFFTDRNIVPLRPELDSPDELAVEDPTIVTVYSEEGVAKHYVFHTAVRPNTERGEGVIASIQVASGPSLTKLGNKQVVLGPEETGSVLGMNLDMVKEPELVGPGLIAFEIADGQKSSVAIADIKGGLTGPYKNPRVLFGPRPNEWDSLHVSTGPTVSLPGGDVLMLYNGCGYRSPDDQRENWCVGAVIIDPKTGNIIEGTRTKEPIIVPRIQDLGYSNKFVAFASSLVEKDGQYSLYHHVADERVRAAMLDIGAAL